jgi:hypothetical protein
VSAEDRPLIDHALVAAFGRLGREKERQEAALRLTNDGQGPRAAGTIEELRTQVRALFNQAGPW